MSEFLIDCNLHNAHSEAFMELIPSQRAIVNDLMFEGRILNYSVSMDRKKLWMVVTGENEEQVMELLSQFPLIDFMDVEIHPLLFHNSPQRSFAQISLN
ncbi:MAG: muconolactone Delta-isomerase family protein [Chitinophagales bacterium]